jgi:hypothetical protein
MVTHIVLIIFFTLSIVWVLLKPQHFRSWFYYRSRMKGGQMSNLLGLLAEQVPNLVPHRLNIYFK